MLELSLHRTLARQRRIVEARRRRAGYGIVVVLVLMEIVLFTSESGVNSPVTRNFLVQMVMLGAALVLFGVRAVIADAMVHHIDATREVLDAEV